MEYFSSENSIIEPVLYQKWIQSGVEVYVKREDLIDPIVSGNKWRKLKYNIDQFRLSQKEKVLSFGGAYSNHLHALARVGQKLNIETVGIVRGEKPERLSQTLLECEEMGMHLHFVSRENYKDKKEKWFHDELRSEFGSIFIIPEGGNNFYGLIGCQEILKEVNRSFDHVFTGIGTGTTFAGIITSGFDAEFHGVSALKGDFHQKEIELFLKNNLSPIEDFIEKHQVSYISDAHFGGFARWNESLIVFMRAVYQETQIKLDAIYNAKVWFALDKMIEKRAFKSGQKILLIHTGGLQGNKGLEQRFDFKIYP